MVLPFLLTLMRLWSALPHQPRTTVQADYEALVASERTFAQAGLYKGIRDSFVEHLDDSQSIVYLGDQFRPGKSTYERISPGPGKLSWQPNYAEIAASGTLGYTTGPFEFRPKTTDDTPVSYGQFTSIWHKTPSGDWKVLIDFGYTHSKPIRPAPGLKIPEQFPTKVTAVVDTSLTNRELMQVERAFTQLARTKSLRDAYLPVLPASDSVRLLREGYERYEGATARRLAETATQQIEYQPLQAVTAASGDLGYTYGYATFRQTRQAYLRIWRKRKGNWQLAHEVLTLRF